jgi:dTDP-4-dehydrorhamnose reductase
MRILLTGTSGQIGGALKPLLSVGHELIAPDRVEFDLSRTAMLSQALNRLAPELIVNPAAYTAVDRAEDEIELAMAVNGVAPGEIARWAASRGVPMVHFSTDYVFEGSGERPWREIDPCAPTNVYGRSKLAGEDAIRAAGGPHLILRTAWVFASQGANFMRTIVRLAREREELRVVTDQFGTPTSARSIAAAVNQILLQGSNDLPACFGRSEGLVHLVNSGATNWHGFASAIVAGLRGRGVPLEVVHIVPVKTAQYPTKAKRPANSRLETVRLAQAYGIVPQTWEQALGAELDAFLAAETSGG